MGVNLWEGRRLKWREKRLDRRKGEERRQGRWLLGLIDSHARWLLSNPAFGYFRIVYVDDESVKLFFFTLTKCLFVGGMQWYISTCLQFYVVSNNRRVLMPYVIVKTKFSFLFFFANSMSGFLLILEFAKCTITDSLVINPPHLSSFFYWQVLNTNLKLL